MFYSLSANASLITAAAITVSLIAAPVRGSRISSYTAAIPYRQGNRPKGQDNMGDLSGFYGFSAFVFLMSMICVSSLIHEL